MIKPFLHPTALGEAPSRSDPLRVQNLLNDCCLAISLVGPSCSISAGYWFQFDDPDLNEAAFYTGVSTHLIEVLPRGFAPPTPLDLSETSEVVNRFLALGEPLRGRLRLALERLNQAQRRPPHGDKALDLAIALEILLTEGPGENTYKVGLRAVLVLDAAPGERLRARSVIGGLYELRSGLAHNGILPSGVKLKCFGKTRSPEVVEKATVLCAKVLRSILFRGQVPDWYSFELGAPGPPTLDF